MTARAWRTSGVLSGSKYSPSTIPRRSRVCASVASASRSWLMASRSSIRTRAVPSLTTSPRSTRTWVTRPSISEATSVWASAMRAPVTSRPMGSIRSSAGATETATAFAAVSGCADGLASVLPQPAMSAMRSGVRAIRPGQLILWEAWGFIGVAPRGRVDQRYGFGRSDHQCAHPGQPRLRAGSVRVHPVPLAKGRARRGGRPTRDPRRTPRGILRQSIACPVPFRHLVGSSDPPESPIGHQVILMTRPLGRSQNRRKEIESVGDRGDSTRQQDRDHDQRAAGHEEFDEQEPGRLLCYFCQGLSHDPLPFVVTWRSLVSYVPLPTKQDAGQTNELL